jgi:hypothetical protein
MSVCLSAWNNSIPTSRVLIKFDIYAYFLNLSKKIQVSWTSDTNNKYLLHANTFSRLLEYLAKFFLEWEIF